MTLVPKTGLLPFLYRFLYYTTRNASWYQTITKEHLNATATSEGRLKEMLGEALKGEADLAEPEGADERLLEALGIREPEATAQHGTSPSVRSGGIKPGDRSPGRDPIGPDSDENSEQAVG